MNIFARASAIVALSVMGFSGVAQAGSMQMNMPDTIDQTIGTLKAGQFNIVYVNSLDTVNWVNSQGPKEVASLQSAIRGNRTVAKALASRNVGIKNVVGAEQAADGDITFYVQ